MFTASAWSAGGRLESIINIILAGEIGNAMVKANDMADVQTQMKFDKLLNNDLKANISNALSTRKKTARNGLVNLLRYSLKSRRVTSKQIVSIALKERYDK